MKCSKKTFLMLCCALFLLVVTVSNLKLNEGRSEKKLRQASTSPIFHDRMIKLSTDNANYYQKQLDYWKKKQSANKKYKFYDKLVALYEKLLAQAKDRVVYWKAQRDKTPYKGKASPKPTVQESKAANAEVFKQTHDDKSGDGPVSTKEEQIAVKTEEKTNSVAIDTTVEDFNMKGTEGTIEIACIAMLRLKSGKMYSFFLNKSSQIVYRIRDKGSWGPLVVVASNVKNCPTAVVSPDESRIDVFAVSSNDQIQTTSLNKDKDNYTLASSGLTALPTGNFSFSQAVTYSKENAIVSSLYHPMTGPAAVNAKGVLHVFKLGTDKKVYRSTFANNAWSAWALLAEGNFLYGISASSNASGRIDVFGVGADNQIYYSNSSNNGASWSAFANIAGSIKASSTPSSVTLDTGAIHLLVLGDDQQMYYRKYDGKAWSEDYENLAGWATSPASTVLVKQDYFVFFKRSWNNDLWGRENQNEAWGAWNNYF